MKKKFTNSLKALVLAIVLLGVKTGHAQCAANFTQTINANGNVTFTSTSTPASSLTVYYWTFGNGSTTYTAMGSAGMFPTSTYTANGTYTVTLFIITSSPTCSTQTQHTINVTTVVPGGCGLVSSFTSAQAGNGAVNFVSTSSGTVSGTTYLWHFGDGASGSGQSTSHTYATNGSYTARLIANNNFTTVCIDSTQTTVNVNSICNLNANFSSSTNSNGNVSFTNLTTPSTTATYTWSFGNSTSSNLANPNVTYAANGTYIVTLQAHTNSPNCTSTFTVAVVVSNVSGCNLNANFSASQGSNGLVNFNNTSTGTVGGTTYSWNFGNGQTSTSNSPSNTYTANGAYVVTLNATNNSTPACTSTKTLTVYVNSICNLAAGFTYSLGANGSVQFVNTTTGSNSITTSYSWNFSPGTSTQMNPSHTFANGTYVVVLTATNFSPSCSSTFSSVITVTSNTCVANANFSLLPTTTPQYWNAIPGGSNITGAQWSWGDGGTSNTLYTSHLYSVSATYTICLTVTVSCGATDTYCNSYFVYKPSAGSATSSDMIRVDVLDASTVGLKALQLESAHLSVSPNPNNGEFKLNISGLSSDNTSKIYITNMVGEVVYVSDAKATNGTLTSDINLGTISSGVYFVKIENGNKYVIQKIIIAK